MRTFFRLLLPLFFLLTLMPVFGWVLQTLNSTPQGLLIPAEGPLAAVFDHTVGAMSGLLSSVYPFLLLCLSGLAGIKLITSFSRGHSRPVGPQERKEPQKVSGWELATPEELAILTPEELQDKVDSRNVLSADIAELKVRLQDPVLARGSANQRVIQKRAALEEALAQARIAGVSHRAGLDDDEDAALLERVRRNIREVLK